MSLIKARTATTVPMADKRHVAINAGDTVDLDDVSGTFRDLWDDGDRWLHSLFEETSEASRGDGSGLVFEDPVQRAMVEHEALVRERVALPMAERVGMDNVPAVSTDRFRTKPTSGADLEGDRRVANGTADTSENLDIEGKTAEDAKAHGDAAGSDERAMPGDQPAASSAPSAPLPDDVLARAQAAAAGGDAPSTEPDEADAAAA